MESKTTKKDTPIEKKSSKSVSNKETLMSSLSEPTSLSSEENSLSSMNSLDQNVTNKELEKEYLSLNCDDENFYSNDCNKFLLKKEFLERTQHLENEDENSYLYPNFNDPNFNFKIANKKEFYDTKYDGTIHEDLEKYTDELSKLDFELQPHQAFVKNFMSSQTPYNSLLLYHGLGTGKTCSAIGVCEDMRDYMKQMGINKRIIIVASENVQDNFKLQLFDERKLKEIDGIWNIKSCIGNKLLKEINPMNMKGMKKEKVVSQIKNLINTQYIFLGYVQFANYIIKTMHYDEEVQKQKLEKSKSVNAKNPKEKSKINTLKDIKIVLNSRIMKRLQNEFDNRLIVIDEVHNIRKTDDNENKKVAINLELLVKSAKNMRFVLLSATPMYNSYKEIVWLLNLMNTNDRRARIKDSDIFHKNGKIKNEELLMRKSTGYISFVRGENPYTFPYRVYPNDFAKELTFKTNKNPNGIRYPYYQMNLKKIAHEEKKRILSLYLTKINECDNCGKCQYCCYKYIIYNLRNKQFSITTKKGVVKDMPSFENMESFGYTLLQKPIESLIISYPIPGLKRILDDIPREEYSEELSSSFESLDINDKTEYEEEDDQPGPIEETPQEEEEETLQEEEEKVKSIKKTTFRKQKPLIVEYDNESDDDNDNDYESDDDNDNDKTISNKTMVDSDKTLVDSNKTLVDSNKTLVDSNKTLVDSDKTLVDSDKTLVDSDKTLVDSDKTLVDSSSKGGANSTSSSIEKKNMSIDPNQLTGKMGLERMMNFVDEKSPPNKGEFEYKKDTLDKYGKIFTYDEIGNYSIKIKTILDNIYNRETDKVSEGVILIYSQYIDSGLIPMALALEEMGFTRYGQGVKPLFKNKKSSDVVDVRTMKKQTDKSKFKPARYSMITGDTRLSPDNAFEIKGLTDDNKDSGNIEGHKVKVVLISKAGSEGIDFKFIRQIHILEPWYNMNRIEQIIGRGVRNFSHKDLPFSKRNVEIFMYGTILGNNKEEAADLYVYRVAEYKAIQIGKVTRVLKESAVDCIINHEQTNFTQEEMNKRMKEPINQELSNGVDLDDFKIGDAPFSPTCDYMAECNYDCRPNKEIDEENLNEDTYNESFIIMNSEKILQRIRMLMKEGFFYKKDILLEAIRTPKEYPYVQIFSALTQLIEDENEFITDKYGRNGRLVNIGDYYLFQPVELTDKNLSIFDRSVPIDYKHSMINFEINQDIVKPVIDKRNLNNMGIKDVDDEFSDEKKIIDEMKVNFELSREYSKKNKVPRADDNWYKHCGIVSKKMSKEYPESREYLIGFLVAHMIELLLFEDKLKVMNYLYSLESITKNTFEWFAKEYFVINSITANKFTVFILYKLNKRIIMILNKDNIWVEAEPEDQREIAKIKKVKDFLEFTKEDYNKIVGFIGYEKKNRYLVFKTKDIDSIRDTGARCSDATKAKNLTKLNEILNETKYTNENTKAVKDEDGNVITEAVGNVELCVTQEFILRYFDIINQDKKKWFLTPEMALYHKLYTIYI